MKKHYTGQLTMVVGEFDGEFGDLVAKLAAHPDLRFVPSEAKARISTMGQRAFGDHYGVAIKADQRRIMRAVKS